MGVYRGSTLGHCITMQHLMEKFTSSRLVSLYTAFLDLTPTFASISRGLLWEKLKAMNIDNRLYYIRLERCLV